MLKIVGTLAFIAAILIACGECQYQTAWLNDFNSSTIISNDTFNCFKYFKIGSKQIIWNGNNTIFSNYVSQNLVSSNNITGHLNSVLIAYTSPLAYFFTTYVDKNFNKSVCDTLWMTPYNSSAYGCDLARTAMYQCTKRNQSCGFLFNKKTYTDKILMGQTTANCSDLASFPLFFDGKPQDFQVFGGWRNYRYALTDQVTKLCQCPLSNPQRVSEGHNELELLQ